MKTQSGASFRKDRHYLREPEILLPGFVFPIHIGSDGLKAAKLNIKGRTNAAIQLVKVKFPGRITGVLVVSGGRFFFPSCSDKNQIIEIPQMSFLTLYFKTGAKLVHK